MMDDDGVDDYMTTEQAYEAGWIDSDDAQELRDLLKHVPWPTELTEGRAALFLIDYMLNPPGPLCGDHQRMYEWAKVKLGRDVLI